MIPRQRTSIIDNKRHKRLTVETEQKNQTTSVRFHGLSDINEILPFSAGFGTRLAHDMHTFAGMI